MELKKRAKKTLLTKDGAEKNDKKTFGDEGWSPSDKITGLLKLLLRDTFTNIRLTSTFYFWDDNRQKFKNLTNILNKYQFTWS